jgi:hypothetical protein
MTSGKWLVLVIVGVTAIFGAAQWYFQTRAFYAPITAEAADLRVTLGGGAVVPLEVTGFDGIDADTSPLRLRGCFTVTDTAPLADALPYDDAAPLVAPGWFDCFDAEAIGAALEAGEITAYLGAENSPYGIDRIIAVAPDGSGFAWNQLNECGEAAFSSDPLPADCPPAPEGD